MGGYSYVLGTTSGMQMDLGAYVRKLFYFFVVRDCLDWDVHNLVNADCWLHFQSTVLLLWLVRRSKRGGDVRSALL